MSYERSSEDMARLTRLEDRLRQDGEGRCCGDYLAQLAAAESHLNMQLRQPLAPDVHRALQAQLAACRAAAEVVECLWHRYHPDASLRPLCTESKKTTESAVIREAARVRLK